DFFCRDLVGYRLSLFLNLIRERKREAIFGQDRSHFRVVLSLYPQNIGDRSYRIFGAIGPIGDFGNRFYSVFRAIKILQWNKDIAKHLSVVGYKEGEGAGNFYDAGEFHLKTLEDLDNFSFLSFAFTIGENIGSDLVAI